MQIIKQETDRTIYDGGDIVLKRFLNTTQTPTGLQLQIDLVNSVSEMNLITEGAISGDWIEIVMRKLEPSNITHDTVGEVCDVLQFFVQNFQRCFPYCAMDVSADNIMIADGRWVMIDWDDVLLGHINEPRVCVAELIREATWRNPKGIDKYFDIVNTAFPFMDTDTTNKVRKTILDNLDDLESINFFTIQGETKL